MTIVERMIQWLEHDSSQETDMLSKKQAAKLLEMFIFYEKKQLEKAYYMGYLSVDTDFEKYYASISKREQDEATLRSSNDLK